MIHKVSAFIIILFANIVLLANAIIPHHHHNNEVCVEKLQCETDAEDHKDGATTPNHECDGETNPEFCGFKQTFVIPANQSRQEIKYLDFGNNHFQTVEFRAELLDKELSAPSPIILSNNQLTLFFTYSHYATTCLGMRAPPVV